jgi:hypothetical protein
LTWREQKQDKNHNPRFLAAKISLNYFETLNNTNTNNQEDPSSTIGNHRAIWGKRINSTIPVNSTIV